MRHLLSVVLALVLTPLIYVSAGYSAVKFEEANATGTIAVAPAALGLIAAFVAGGLYALLVMARLSPLGPVLGGLAYLGVTLWALFDLTGFHSAVPGDLFGVKGLLHVPVGFGTAMLAVPLLVTVFSPRRWRRSVTPEAETAPVSPYGSAPGSAAPGEPPSVAPSYQSPLYPPPASPAYPGGSTPVGPAKQPDTLDDPDRTRYM
jgi:hypothetical protein